jgi:hypothetical protein
LTLAMTRLLALLTIFAALAVPASAADPAPTPDCHGINVTDKKGDSANSLETSQTGSPSSDLIAGFLTYNPASGKAAANIQVDNLTAGEVDAPYDAISWEFSFSVDGKAPRYVRAYQDVSGMVKYNWGEPRAVTDDQTTPRAGGTTTGALFPGANGIIHIDIPLADIGIKPGAVLKGLAMEVRQWASLPAAVPNTSAPLYSPAPVYDDAAGKGSFTVGPCTQPAPVAVPGTPSEPVATPAAPATLDVKVTVPKLKAAKLRKGRKVALKLKGTASGISAALHKGSTPDGKVVATGKLASLKGSGKLSLKLKAKLAKGKYTLTLAGRNADGRAAAGSLAVRVR